MVTSTTTITIFSHSIAAAGQETRVLPACRSVIAVNLGDVMLRMLIMFCWPL